MNMICNVFSDFKHFVEFKLELQETWVFSRISVGIQTMIRIFSVFHNFKPYSTRPQSGSLAGSSLQGKVRTGISNNFEERKSSLRCQIT